MPEARQLTARSAIGSLALIAAVVAFAAAAFAYTAGWFSPDRLTPDKLVEAFTPPATPPLGHRRNHAKGICFTGIFEANGAGSELSQAQVFARGQYPVLGRFNLATPDPNAADATVRVRGLGLSITTPDGQEWRSAMIDAAGLPRLDAAGVLRAAARLGQQGPERDEDVRRRASRDRDVRRLGQERALDRQLCGGAVQQPQQLHLHRQFRRGACGAMVALPAAQPVAVSPDELAKRGPDFLEQEITERVRGGPQRWTMVVTVANPGDPTADPTKAWPEDRRTVEVGTLTVQQIEAEADGPCRDINFDPTVLPTGIRTSDDPFPAARSAAYARSYDLRTAEAKDYPRTPAGSKPMTGVPTLHPAAAPAALADGRLHSGHAVHRRRHGVDRRAEIPDACFDPQAARHRHSGAGADPPRRAPALRRAAAAGRSARADEARGASVALRALRPDDRACR